MLHLMLTYCNFHDCATEYCYSFGEMSLLQNRWSAVPDGLRAAPEGR